MELKFVRMEVIAPQNQNRGQATQLGIRIAHGIEKTNIDAFTAAVKALSTAGNTLAADDKVFFTPWSEVPRYKFNEYAREKPKMARVITYSKCTAVVIEPSRVLGTICSQGYDQKYYKVPKTILQYHTNVLQGKKYDELADVLYMRAHELATIQALVPFNHSLVQSFDAFEYYSYTDTSAVEERVEIMNEIIRSPRKLLSDMVLLEEINQGVHITTDVYDQLCFMLKSTDVNNIGLAMELMANADYKKSEFKIALLLNRFRNKITTHKNAGLVNFRSLLNYFSKYNWQSGDVQFAASIVRNAQPSMNDYQERLDLSKKAVLDYVNSILDNDIFGVNEVEIKYSPKLSTSVQLEEIEVGELEEG